MICLIAVLVVPRLCGLRDAHPQQCGGGYEYSKGSITMCHRSLVNE